MVEQQTARIVRVDGPVCTVEASTGERLDATRARSCLLAPEAGDLVLLARVRGVNANAYVLAILERESDAGSIAVEGNLDLKVPEGTFTVAAAKGINLVTHGTAAVVAGEMNLHAEQARVGFKTLSYVGAKLDAHLQDIKTVADSVERVVDRFTSRLHRAYRYVRDVDMLRAGRVDTQVETVLNMRANTTLMTAKELVKVDADQIHFG